MKVGLALGKYAPFHKGHQLVVETAIKEMDHVIVMIYDSPQVTSIPLPVRANWIRTLYPSVEVIEAYNGPDEVGYTPRVIKINNDYVVEKMIGKNVTHFYSSEPYGEYVSQALNTVNRLVDMDRTIVPISATEIRNDHTKAKEYLSDVVYKDHVINVVLLGAPSTGKSTLTEALAGYYSTEFMPEYGREYWDKYNTNRRLTKEQLVEIADGHISRENIKILNANKYLFTDTNALTTRIFSRYYHNEVHPKLDDLANQCVDRYHLYLVCDTDIPYDDTEDRSGDANRHDMQHMIIDDLKNRGINYYTIKGSLDNRIAQVNSILSDYGTMK